MNWTRENLQWAAGILEGEGSFESSRKSKRIKITCQMHARDKDVMERLRDVLGGGLRYYAHGGNKKQTPLYVWYLSRKDDVYAAVVALYQFMGARRKKQIEAQIEYYAKVMTNKCKPRVLPK